MIRELWTEKRLTTRAYPVTGANVSAGPTPVPIEITQYAQEDVFDRLIIRVVGNVVVAGGGASGTATGQPNPHGLLNKLTLQTQPQYKGVVPFNNVSGRSLLTDASFARGFFLNNIEAPIPDVAGTYPVDFYYEMYFKRPRVRKGIQWAFYLQKYTSALLTTNFGGREQLFTGGTNTWDLTALSIQLWADSDLAVTATDIHASEVFEQTYVVPATQSDFPIDTLPPGYLYTDFFFQVEQDGVLKNNLLNNIDIEGGGRQWTRQGDSNAPFIQSRITRPELSDQTQDVTGIYVLPLRDGMFTRAVDALTAPITIKLDVTHGGTITLIRLLCRRMIPQGVQAMAKTAPKTNLPNVAGH
jgi:hypothetical protein